MALVHATAMLDGEIDLADDVVIGPNCVISGKVRLGAGCRLIGNIYLTGPLTMGERNIVYPFACLGFAPQHARFDPSTDGQGTLIGSDNIFREHTTVHRAFKDDAPTTIGSHNTFMVNAHVAHDCKIANNVTMVNNTAIGGHVQIDDRATIGGGCVVHQFCHLGEGAMLGGGLIARNSVLPWFMLTDTDTCAAINLIGLRRNGFTTEEIGTVRWVFGTLMREGLPWSTAVERLRTRKDEPIVKKYLDFIDQSDRAITHGGARPAKAVQA